MSHSPAYPPLADAPKGHGELVLVVEDDVHLRPLLVKVLEVFNYRVLVAKDIPQGLDIWKHHRAAIHAVVSDCDLGSARDGISLVREFSEDKPSVVLVVASGSLSPRLMTELHRTTTIKCLQKPYPIIDLLRLLREGLDTPPPHS